MNLDNTFQLTYKNRSKNTHVAKLILFKLSFNFFPVNNVRKL